MDGRITYLLFMFTLGRVVVQTKCTSRKMFTCGKSAHCTIVHDGGKRMAIKIVRSSNKPICFCNTDYVMVSREIFSCLFKIYEYICG